MLVFKIMDIVFIAAFFILLCETAIRLILRQNKPTIEEQGGHTSGQLVPFLFLQSWAYFVLR